MSDSKCLLAKLALNLDMSGMVSPCNITSHWLKDSDKNHFRLDSTPIQQIWDSDSRKELIDAHDRGVKPEACSGCWNTELAGNLSARQMFNEKLKDVEVIDSQPRILIMKPGNRCNVACRSCNEHTSSSWYKDAYALSKSDMEFKDWLEFFHPHRNTYENNQDLEDTLGCWQKDIIFWDLYGGEPLMIPLSHKIIEDSVNSGSSVNQELQIHTNGTIYDPQLASRLSKFKKVYVAFSIDALGRKNEYIRRGTEWSKTMLHLERYRNDFKDHPHITFSVRTTVTPLNVLYLDETYDHFVSNGFVTDFGNVVTDHPYNNVQYLHRAVKQKIIEKLIKYVPAKHEHRKWQDNLDHLSKFMNFEPTDYELHTGSFLSRNNKMDVLRGEKFIDIFPEMHQLLSQA